MSPWVMDGAVWVLGFGFRGSSLQREERLGRTGGARTTLQFSCGSGEVVRFAVCGRNDMEELSVGLRFLCFSVVARRWFACEGGRGGGWFVRLP